jgi:hypothetical protein
LSDSLTGALFSALATGDDVAPCKLPASAATASERTMKEAEVFGNMCAEVLVFWRRKRLNGHAITTSSIAAQQGSNVIGFSVIDHALAQEFLASSKAKIASRPDLWALRTEFLEAFKHVDRTGHFCVMQKCDEDDPCDWCRDRPWVCREYYNFLKGHSMRHPRASWSTEHTGHARTWLETKATAPGILLAEPDSIEPSVVAGAHGKCDKCPAFGYSTVTDKEHHLKYWHRPFKQLEAVAEPTNTGGAQKKRKAACYNQEPLSDVRRLGRKPNNVTDSDVVHKCRLCLKQFGSSRQLKVHRKEAGHDIAGRAQAAISLATKRKAAEAMLDVLVETVPTSSDAAIPGVAAETTAVVPGVANEAIAAGFGVAAEATAARSDVAAEAAFEDEPCEVVGMRRVGETFDCFLWWTNHNKDDCTYESTANAIDSDFLVGKNIQIHYSNGSSIDVRATSLCDPSGSVYKLER